MSTQWTTEIWNTLLSDNKNIDTAVGNQKNARDVLHGILYGTANTPPAGHWVVYRKFDRTRYSRFWNPIKGEAIGGPKYPWQDILLRTRRYKCATETEAKLREAILEPGDWLYYFEYTEGITVENSKQSINIEECLYEIDTPGSVTPPSITYDNLTEKFEFTRIEPVYDLYGRIEYFIVIARRTDGGRW